jgi:hypothetical protein
LTLPGRLAAEVRGCWGANEEGNDVSSVGLQELGVGFAVGRVHGKRWGWFFWFVPWRGDGRMGLSTDFKRRRAGALWLGLIFACGGADGNGWRNVGAAAVENVGVNVDGVVVAAAAAAAAGGGGDDDAGVESLLAALELLLLLLSRCEAGGV